MAKPLRVGIIGASLKRGWAKESHVPAVQKLAGLELAAVTARDQKTAETVAEAVGAKRGFGYAAAMVRDPEIDLITVTVRVPSHRELVLQALAAGKHVYCEYPLGRDVAETEELRDVAKAAGVHVAIGLQARMNPALRRARELISGGALGRVLTAHIYSGTVAFGRKTSETDVYLEDAANGATHLTIHVGHALDAAVCLLGGFADVAALASIQFPEIEVGDQERTQRRSIADHILTQSRLQTGGAVSAEVAGGRSDGATFRFEIVGDGGILMLDGAAPRGFQSGRLTLALDGELQSVDEGELAELSDPAFNVGGVYAALRDDIAKGQASVPDFDHAVRLARLIADVSRATETDCRVEENQWLTS